MNSAIETQRPRVGVAVIILRDDRILLGKRKSALGDGSWGFPGGHLEWSESPQECAVREVKEETNLDITPWQLGPYTNDIFEVEKKHYITLFVIAKSHAGKPKIMEPDKCAEWRWVKWHDLPSPLFLPIQNLLKIGFSPFRWSGFNI